MKHAPNRLFLELLKRALNGYLHLGGKEPFESYIAGAPRRYWNFRWKIPDECRPASVLSATQFDALEAMIVDVVERRVPGDFIEAGAWNGGACIFMAGVLKSLGVVERKVYVADSFEGIPKSTLTPEDPVDRWKDRWVAPYDKVVATFRRFGMLEENVVFLRGPFAQTLPQAPFRQLAIARLDCDSYESTTDALRFLYPKISLGGYLYVDDWHLPSCRRAVSQFRTAFGIDEPIDKSVDAMWKVQRPLSTAALTTSLPTQPHRRNFQPGRWYAAFRKRLPSKIFLL